MPNMKATGSNRCPLPIPLTASETKPRPTTGFGTFCLRKNTRPTHDKKCDVCVTVNKSVKLNRCTCHQS